MRLSSKQATLLLYLSADPIGKSVNNTNSRTAVSLRKRGLIELKSGSLSARWHITALGLEELRCHQARLLGTLDAAGME